MKVSECWLREWVNPSLSGSKLAARLTMAGLEVDSIYPVAGVFDKVIVAHVLETTPHPKADKLTLCEVDIGTGTSAKVVCGAQNVRPGLKVAMALPGAHLPNDIVIQKTALRGEPSEGMLCSTAELGLEDSASGIMELPNDAPIGTDLRAYLNLNDQVFDLDLTPNRGDCFSVLGVAREVAALTKTALQSPKEILNTVHSKISKKVFVKEALACPQYVGRVISGINPQAITPLWMKERLRRAGIRTLHPVVDITNYVMIELGQPLHAFDLKAINGAIEVRYAQPKESLILLDEKTLALDSKALVIADEKQPLALAGIMGGLGSAVDKETVDIFLESAYFNSKDLALTARKHGLSTESSQRFERGVDPALQVRALERATELVHEILGGEIGPMTVVTQDLPKKEPILFHPSKVARLIGLEISEKDMQHFLESLGMTVDASAFPWRVTAPSYRFDLALDVDLVEEIVRLYGYDQIKAGLINGSLMVPRSSGMEALLEKTASFLSDRGYHETISYSFVDKAFQAALYKCEDTMQLLNPISSELSEMRVGMWPGLIASMVHNKNRQQSAIKLFENGVIFEGKGDALKEKACIAGLITGESGALNWSEATRSFDFFDMKGDLQALFRVLNVKAVDFLPAIHEALHPGQSAKVQLQGEDIGWFGALHPQWMDALELNEEVFLFELSLKPLLTIPAPHYQAISKYPQIRRDLSLLVNNEIDVLEIERVVREVISKPWLKKVDIFDVYSGTSIEKTKKSIGIALTLQDDSRTLVDAEINQVIDAIIKTLNDKFAIILRD